MSARYELHESVAVIMLDNPPVNGLGHATRSGVAAGIERANADPAVDIIVLIGAGKAFSGGADIREFNTPKATAEPRLVTVIRGAEASAKPVVAAIGGACMGGGLELALGCHFRIARPDAVIALPEVRLGLLPGAGGTQRLPRVVGVPRAMQMIVSGASVPAKELHDTRLFDAIVDGDLLEGALAFARTAIAEHRPATRVRDLAIDCPDIAGIAQSARTKAAVESKGQPAPQRCIDAVAAAVTMPFDEGLAFERKAFEELVTTPESRAMRHAFFAERAAARIPGVADATPIRKIGSIAVIGAGTMGTGIAMNALSASIPVVLLEMNQEALDRGVATVRRNYEASVERGKLAPEALDRNMALLRPTLAYDDLAAVDLVIEAVFEELDLKRQVFASVDRVAKPGAILASNTSTLDLNRIAAATSRPQDVIGMHFFSPAQVMKLLEVVRGERTADDVLMTVMALAKKLGKTAVVSGVCDGFIGNRMVEQYLRQAMFLLEEGASPQQVDAALEDFGMAMGPFRMSDLAGNDVGWRIRKRRYVEKPHVTYSRIADRLCEAGRFGQKTGKGWYAYEPGQRKAIPDPAVDALIAEYRAELKLKPRAIDNDEIVGRCVLALVNEGARILEEGIALRASDIDVVYLAGYGFPRYRGGPIFYADFVGLAQVADRMRQFAAQPHADTAFWQPAPLLARLAADGKRFSD
jgi:3-hydroxyacyl-CoA dehydrogenase